MNVNPPVDVPSGAVATSMLVSATIVDADCWLPSTRAASPRACLRESNSVVGLRRLRLRRPPCSDRERRWSRGLPGRADVWFARRPRTAKRRTARHRLATAKSVIFLEARSLSTVDPDGQAAGGRVGGELFVAFALVLTIPCTFARRIHASAPKTSARPCTTRDVRTSARQVISGNHMRRYLPLCLLVTLLAHLSGAARSPNRPSVVTEIPENPPKTSARFIQVPWDISLFFNLPGGAVVAGATTAATSGSAAEGDNLTGTFVNSTRVRRHAHRRAHRHPRGGTFDGTLSTITRSGCTAERRFSGPINSQALNWSPGAQVNDCGGTSPLTSGIQATAAPPIAPAAMYLRGHRDRHERAGGGRHRNGQRDGRRRAAPGSRRRARTSSRSAPARAPPTAACSSRWQPIRPRRSAPRSSSSPARASRSRRRRPGAGVHLQAERRRENVRCQWRLSAASTCAWRPAAPGRRRATRHG